MSYEKVSAVRINCKKGTLSFKSHSNNDDAKPTWWEANGNTLEEKVAHAYMMHKQGEIRFSSKTGKALDLQYAFAKIDDEINASLKYPKFEDYATYGEYSHAAQEYFKEASEMARNGAKTMIEAIVEKDDGKKYAGYYHCYWISSYSDISFVYGNKPPKELTAKGVYLAKRMIKNSIPWEIKYIRFEEVGA